ncbi:calcium-dependent lipid-binding family protein isoform X2 [Wolffia australiana]
MFDTSGALDKLRKSLQLSRLAVYHDSDTLPWTIEKRWEDLSSTKWTEIFVGDLWTCESEASPTGNRRNFVVSPIDVILKYHRIGKQDRNDIGAPLERVSLFLSDISLTVSEVQYCDGIKLLESLSQYRTRVEFSHLRPTVGVLDDPKIWWRYFAQANLQKKRMCLHFSWDRIRALCHYRRNYVQLYANFLLRTEVDTSGLRRIERDLEPKVILLWRLLAHAKVESVKSKEATQIESDTRKTWFPLRWRTYSQDVQTPSALVEGNVVDEKKLSKEEWELLNKLLSYYTDDDARMPSGNDARSLIRLLVDVSIFHAAARIVSMNHTEILCGRFDQLQVTAKMYKRTVHYDLSLKFYGLSSPEGSLIQSVSSEKKANALSAAFIHLPAEENVDWKLSATIAPCHVTVLMKSYERFSEFIKRSSAVSPNVAIETATALQMKIEKVTRRAQEQFQIVLEEKNRFALDIDFDAPKVRIPLKEAGFTNNEDFFLDFGHFTLRARDHEREEGRQSLYSRFYITVRDIAAFFMDGNSNSGSPAPLRPSAERYPLQEDHRELYSLIDRCGMSIVVDMIKIAHPRYPSTRVSMQVPAFNIHFSPERYYRLINLLGMLNDSRETEPLTTDTCVDSSTPWYPADLSANARILVWRGIGNSLAEWKSCFVVLSGLYLYILESESSQSYQRCTSMGGRQVFEVSPSSVGGSLFSIAVGSRGTDMQKALESSNTLIIEFHGDTDKATWLKELVQATYRASAPPAIDILGDNLLGDGESSGTPTLNLGNPDLVISGALLETSLSIYGSVDKSKSTVEEIILEVLAVGGKVNLVRSEAELSVKMKLHSLKIKDELQACLSGHPQFLACSTLKDNINRQGSLGLQHHDRVFSNFLLEEGESFGDALSDFVTTSDLSPRMCGSEVGDMWYGMDFTEFSIEEKEWAKGKTPREIFYEAQDETLADFIAVSFLTRSADSPKYDDIDTRMTVCMSKLDFFCNRPTLLALIEFGVDMSYVNLVGATGPETNISEASSSNKKGSMGENGYHVIKGLLGHGKGRVVFDLSMDVGSVCIYLNNEDGSKLAMFAQECFLLNIKVHPNSFYIEGRLGNLRIRDLSPGIEHTWGWLCDLRNQEVESLVKVTLQSYSITDDDYKGYDYSLDGQLSEVQIVFLNRFVQEITTYFLELGTPRSEEAVKLVDKVGNFEWLIQKYEIEGASSIKLDLSLHTPIIIIPGHSSSRDFLQLDLGQLHLSNSLSWHGCQEEDPFAVHMDILDIQVSEINMAVGVDGCLGMHMIREEEGFHIKIRRSLRDVFRRVPTIYVDVTVGNFHCVMSNKEYKVILDCVSTNVSEEPRLPPSFRGSPIESMRVLADKVHHNSQVLLSRTIAVISLEIQTAMLDLHNGIDEESQLAHLALEGLWLSYRTSSLSETDLYLTIRKLSVLDIRHDTKPEMRLMLGSSYDASGLGVFSNDAHAKTIDSERAADSPVLTMLIMDYHLRSSSQSLVVRIQQPHLLVVLDFILPVVEFFVPAIGVVTGREEMMHPEKDPLRNTDDIVVSESIYFQQNKVVYLSPQKRLIVDGCSVGESIYDGCGGTMHLHFDPESRNKSVGRENIIIIIGRGKRLRFKNIKIENGELLRTCTYLGNDSSYSVSTDDGVQISVLEIDANIYEQQPHGIKNTSPDSDADKSIASHEIKSSSFEIQVLSPEFTFYDSTKLLVDDSVMVEKLLRAKFDLSFMYAEKENDTWVKALLKDFTVEAGSGLIVIDPTDFSGGYSSTKNKTSISINLSDLYVHLSLSVASLLIQLEKQAIEAFQFGNESILAMCTNFKRLWVSQRGNGFGFNLTFWRPQATSNFAILGDCVTSRPEPPSQVVMAVGNAYGRVRKPVGFKIICSLSDIQNWNQESEVDADNQCFLWMPIAPPGYTAMGCVAHPGNGPPPNNVVHCIRSDLVSCTSFSDCILSVESNQRDLSGFSIWRVDNSVGSFYAHSSKNFPGETKCFDFHQSLLSYSSGQMISKSMSKDSPGHGGTHDNISYGKSSGWDIMRSISNSSRHSISTPHFERIWWDKISESVQPISIWRPMPRPGFSGLGDCIVEGLEPPAFGVLFKCDNSELSVRPIQFNYVACVRKGSDELSVWFPVAPPGYVSMGCVITKLNQPPKKEIVCCPRMDLVKQTDVSDIPIFRSLSPKGSSSWSVWKVENQACTFLARSDMKKPSNRLAYSIEDSVKLKTRENISLEMKQGCFSLSVLDSLQQMSAPLLDLTIKNINLATHGRPDSLSATLICSIAASAFNRQVEAWEPLVEPFDGIFKLETLTVSEQPLPRLGKRLRVSTTTAVNANISAANLETISALILSWKGQMAREEKSCQKSSEPNVHSSAPSGLIVSALEEDDSHKVIVENKLGCGIYIRNGDPSPENIRLLENNEQASVTIPPPRFTNQFNAADMSRRIRHYVAIRILEARGLPIQDDGNIHEFFCALRLVLEVGCNDKSRIFPQSARTRVRRVVSLDNIGNRKVKWNEVFIFEVPEMSKATVEMEVTNLGARAGKGEIVGGLSVPVGNGCNTLKRVTSLKMLQNVDTIQNFSSYPLKNKLPGQNMDGGTLSMATALFERNRDAMFRAETGDTIISDRGSSFSIGLDSNGPWENFGALFPVGVIPKSINNKKFAVEVSIKNGRKHTILRPLALVVNDTNIKLEVSTFHTVALQSQPCGSRTRETTETEEIFENQFYSPESGWNSKWDVPGNSYVNRRSNNDFSFSSKDFFEPPLSPGWGWTSPWTIEKHHFGDGEGWVYASDLQSLKWPPASSSSSSEKSLDFVRRRRWVRKKQRTQPADNLRNVFAMLTSGSSAILPWSSMQRDSDLCLQVRPFSENTEIEYDWGLTVNSASGSYTRNEQPSTERNSFFRQSSTRCKNISLGSSGLKLDQLEKKDFFMCCQTISSHGQNFWLSIGADASILHTDLNCPVYDWKISINAPLKIENKLPYNADYTVWEKTVSGGRVERHRGVLPALSSESIYTADLRRPVYLTLFIQGGWALEKDAILIMDISAVEYPSSFWIFHQESRRRLRVNIERDTGAANAATKIVRFFTPYWISNDTNLQLTYQVTEIEPFGNLESELVSVTKPSKISGMSQRQSSKVVDNIVSLPTTAQRRDCPIFEMIEDHGQGFVMLSPQDYLLRSGILSFSSRSEAIQSQRIGIGVAVHGSEYFSRAVSLTELENKGRVDIRAFTPNKTYYKLSAFITMASDRTKVVRFQPQIVFINRTGQNIALKQCRSECEELIHPSGHPKILEWCTCPGAEFLMVHLDGYDWSSPFSLENEGVICLVLKKNKGDESIKLRVEVRAGTEGSTFEVLFRLGSTFFSPYRIENRSMFLPLRIRQVDGSADSWSSLPPNTAISFYWEDLGRQRQLELLIDGSDPSNSEKISIDKLIDHQPLQISSGRVRPLRLSVVKEGKIFACKISDWMPGDEEKISDSGNTELIPLSSISERELQVSLELADFGLSIIDHTPEEIIYLSIHHLLFSYSNGLGSGVSRFKLQVCGIQVDNQLPFTPMPVLLRMQRIEDHLNHVLKFSVSKQASGSIDLSVYPYIGFQGPVNSVFLVNIHEPIIWRLHEMFQKSKFGSMGGSQTNDVPVDPTVKIGLLNISEVRFRVSMGMSPAQRPHGVLGFWSSLMTALGNTEHMPVRINRRFYEDISMRQSALITSAVSSIQKDILSQPLQLLSGVDILGNASSALGHMSKGIAALSMDKKFIQNRQKQESKGVEDLGDVIREGGGALAMGLFRGVTGILTKPLEGAKSSGVEGFVQGVGKGIIGAAAQPVSGVLDLLSKTTEGANAVKMKLASALSSEEQLVRRRLARAIGGDSLLRPYDEYKATGQIILQLAESGTFLGQVDLFKVRSKFALSDAYEDHFLLPKGRILVVTHRRVLLLQQPMGNGGQKKFNPAKDACSVQWDIMWDDLITMELANRKNDNPKSSPSLLILYIRSKSSDSRESTRVVECAHESPQASNVYSSILKAMSTYGPYRPGLGVSMKRKVRKPYSPRRTAVSLPAILEKEVDFGMLSE